MPGITIAGSFANGIELRGPDALRAKGGSRGSRRILVETPGQHGVVTMRVTGTPTINAAGEAAHIIVDPDNANVAEARSASFTAGWASNSLPARPRRWWSP